MAIAPSMEMGQHQTAKIVSEMSDHPDTESDHEIYPISVAPQTEQGVPAEEAGRGRA